MDNSTDLDGDRQFKGIQNFLENKLCSRTEIHIYIHGKIQKIVFEDFLFTLLRNCLFFSFMLRSALWSML